MTASCLVAHGPDDVGRDAYREPFPFGAATDSGPGHEAGCTRRLAQSSATGRTLPIATMVRGDAPGGDAPKPLTDTAASAGPVGGPSPAWAGRGGFTLADRSPVGPSRNGTGNAGLVSSLAPDSALAASGPESLRRRGSLLARSMRKPGSSRAFVLIAFNRVDARQLNPNNVDPASMLLNSIVVTEAIRWR